MCYYSEPESHIRDKIDVVLYLSNYATEKELKDATGVDTLVQLVKVILLL